MESKKEEKPKGRRVRLFPDELDCFILWEIFNAYKKKKDSNTWEMAKRFVKKCGDQDNKDEVFKLYKKITARLNLYCDEGIFFKEKNGDGKTLFSMDLNVITFVKHKFKDGFKWCLLIRV